MNIAKNYAGGCGRARPTPGINRVTWNCRCALYIESEQFGVSPLLERFLGKIWPGVSLRCGGGAAMSFNILSNGAV